MLIDMDPALVHRTMVETDGLCLYDKVANDPGSATKAGSPLVGLRRLIGLLPLIHPDRIREKILASQARLKSASQRASEKRNS
jgi:hypothetical protein